MHFGFRLMCKNCVQIYNKIYKMMVKGFGYPLNTYRTLVSWVVAAEMNFLFKIVQMNNG